MRKELENVGQNLKIGSTNSLRRNINEGFFFKKTRPMDMPRNWPPVWIRGVNIVLTNLCNGRCPYCDFKDWITSEADSSSKMSLSDLDKVIDWVRKSKIEYVQLLGGEPMLHPDIVEVVRKLIESDVKIRCLMTNGLGDTQLYKRITELTDTVWLVTVNDPDTYTGDEWELLNRNLEVLSWRGEDRLISHGGFDGKSLLLQLSIVFYKPEQEYRYLIDLAEKYDCTNVNYSYSFPCGDKSNSYLDIRGQFKLKSTLLSFVRDCTNKGIKALTPNNLCPCIFTTREVRYLMLFSNVKANEGFMCTPHLEVTPDLNVSYCLPMRVVSPSYKVGGMSALDMAEQMLRDVRKYRDYILPHCRDCELHELKRCQGACLRLKADYVGRERAVHTSQKLSTLLKRILRLTG